MVIYLFKCTLNNLQYLGSKAPSKRAAIPGAIADQIATLEADGLSVVTPTKPTTFTDLVARLEEMGLLKASFTPPATVPPPNIPSLLNLQAAHFEQV